MFMSDPDIDLCLKIYNMPETPFMQVMSAVTLPRINVHKVVYLPMLEETLTIDNLKDTAKNYQDYLKKTQDHHGHETSGEQNKEVEEKKTMTQENLGKISHPASTSSKARKDVLGEEFDENEHSRFLTDPSLYDPEKNVMVRVLSPLEFPVDWETRKVDQTMIDQANIKGGDSFWTEAKHFGNKVEK